MASRLPQCPRKLKNVGLSSTQVNTVEALGISAKTQAGLNNVSAAIKKPAGGLPIGNVGDIGKLFLNIYYILCSASYQQVRF